MILRADRWQTSMHEAAHVVTARVLNFWDVTLHAYVLESGCGGYAENPYGLTPFAGAVVSAAGDYGARLAFEAPAHRRRPRRDLTKGVTPDLRAQIETARATVYRLAVATEIDSEAVAVYCAKLHPTEPDEWRQTFDRVHAEARRIVWEHRYEIRRVAEHLFHTGEITIAGDPDQDEMFSGGAVAAGGRTMPDNPAKSRSKDDEIRTGKRNNRRAHGCPADRGPRENQGHVVGGKTGP